MIRIIAYVHVLALLSGCGRQQSASPEASRGSHEASPMAALPVTDVAMNVTGEKSGNVSKSTVTAPEESLSIIGQYKLHPGAAKSPIMLQIMRTDISGVIANSATTNSEQDDDVVRFEGTIRAPGKIGKYELKVYYKQFVIAEQALEVKAE